MNTIGKDKYPDWVKKAVGKRKSIEIKKRQDKYYAYKYKNVWDKEKKRPRKFSRYLGVVTRKGIVTPYDSMFKGVYEYGHVMFVWNLLEKNGMLRPLKENFNDWKTILAFAMNRLIDPRPIKSIKSWYEKTYLVKKLKAPVSPKTLSRVLESVGRDWKSQHAFFQDLKENGEKILYDASVIFSTSEDNKLLEIGYNKDELFLPKVNIVLAFSQDRFIPIFFRILPGTIHEITTLDVLLEELGDDSILVIDKGFTSAAVIKKIDRKGMKFIMPLKRNMKIIDYSVKLEEAFMYRDRPIKYNSYKHEEFFIYLFEDISLRYEEEKNYYKIKISGKKIEFREEWAGTIAIISNMELPPEEVYRMWKARDKIEKSFHVLQNLLDVDRPHVRKEHTFRGYLFSSFIALIPYYLILRMLKEAGINKKVSVADLLLELSKIYMLDINEKEVMSEKSKRVRKLIETLKIENLITTNGER